MKIAILEYFNLLGIETTNERIKDFSEQEITAYHKTAPNEIYERAKDADIIVMSSLKITKETIDKLPKLKFIAVCCTGGYNNIDCEYARKKGITISNVPEYSTKPVAQHTFAFIFAITKRIVDISADNILAFLNGKPQNVVN